MLRTSLGFGAHFHGSVLIRIPSGPDFSLLSSLCFSVGFSETISFSDIRGLPIYQHGRRYHSTVCFKADVSTQTWC